MQLALFDFISGNYLIVKNGWIKGVWEKRKQESFELTGCRIIKTILKEDTGNIYYQEIIKWGDYWELTLKEHYNKLTENTNMSLNIKGCPSKIYYEGFNYDNISLIESLKIIQNLCKDFCLNINDIKLAAPFEPSITISFDNSFDGTDFKNKLIFKNTDRVIKRKSDEKGIFMGYLAKYTHYNIKVYLPSVKFDNPSLYTLRIERQYNRISTFSESTGIKTWGQLLSEKGMRTCGELLLDMWMDVIVIDPTLRISRKKYSAEINEMILEGKIDKYWLKKFKRIAIDGKTRFNYLKQYNTIAALKGEGLHQKIEKLIKIEVDKFPNLTCLGGKIKEYTIEETSITNINNNNKQDKTILPMKQEQVSTPVNNLSKKEKEVTKRKQDQQLEFNFMKAYTATMKTINDNTVAIKQLTKYLQTKAA